MRDKQSRGAVSAIEVYTTDTNDSDADGEDTPSDERCLCCGEGMDVVGICMKCVMADCDVSFDSPCARTGETDPLELFVEFPLTS